MLRELGERQRPELAAHGIDVTDDARPHCDVVLKTRSEDGAFEELHERFVEPGLT